MEILNLNYCGINNISDMVDLLAACRNLDYLQNLLIQEKWDIEKYENLKNKDGHQLLDELKKNVSLTYFLFTKLDFQIKDFKEIENELQINKDNLLDKTKLRDNYSQSQNVEIRINQIKLCLRFKIQLVLDDDKLRKEHLEILENYLTNKDHKIWILNLDYVQSENISKVIKILGKPNLNINNLDIIFFGYKVLAQKDFILFGKWLLNKFTDKRDNEDFKLRNLLFGCSNKLNNFVQDESENQNDNQNIVIENRNENYFTDNNELIQSFKRRDKRKHFYRSINSTLSKNSTAKVKNDNRVEVILYFNRKLYGDDIKMLWLITQKWNKYLILNIKAKELEKESELYESNAHNSSNFVSELFKKKSIVWSYKYSDNIEEQINFHLLVKYSYISFFFHLTLWFIVPILLRHPDWGKGLFWAAHIIFGIYILFSFWIEIFLFLILFKKEIRDTLFEGNTNKFTYFTITMYTFLGLIAKGDIYTDIAFLVEMQKWNEQRNGVYGPVILLIATIVFFMTIAYQLFWFVRLLWKSPNSTFCPLTSHTTRILMCADNRFLAMVIDKFTITYYEKLFCYRAPTHKILVFFKLVFEDIIQFSLQIIYLFLANQEDKNLPIILLSLWFTIPAISISIMTLIYYAGSTLNKEEFDDMANSKLVWFKFRDSIDQRKERR